MLWSALKAPTEVLSLAKTRRQPTRWFLTDSSVYRAFSLRSGVTDGDSGWKTVTGRRSLQIVARGRQGKNKHWSKASLCFDLNVFLAEYTEGGSLLAVDFRNVLRWAITDPVDGQSSWKKPSTYEEPLERSFEEKNKSLYSAESAVGAATPNPNIKEKQFQEILKELRS